MSDAVTAKQMREHFNAICQTGDTQAAAAYVIDVLTCLELSRRQVAALTAEVERLRTALQRMVDMTVGEACVVGSEALDATTPEPAAQAVCRWCGKPMEPRRVCPAAPPDYDEVCELQTTFCLPREPAPDAPQGLADVPECSFCTRAAIVTIIDHVLGGSADCCAEHEPGRVADRVVADAREAAGRVKP